MTRKREVLATEDISDLPPPSHRHPMSGEPIWDQHAVRAMLSKLRAPVADAQTFEQWWPLESHRRKYPNNHPAYLAAREAWEASAEVLATQLAARSEFADCLPEDDGYCESCIGDKCVTGPKCVTLGLDSHRASAPVAEEPCKRCGGPGWYTSHTTGYPESIPCSACNPQGVSAERLEKDPFLAAQLWRKPVDFADAYEGAREDLAIWKRRALEAERDLRAERETSSHLVAELNAENGPMRMGGPAALASAPVAGEALFWYRPRSDGSYEGPIHNDMIENLRKQSGAWVPLVPSASAAAKYHEGWRCADCGSYALEPIITETRAPDKWVDDALDSAAATAEVLDGSDEYPGASIADTSQLRRALDAIENAAPQAPAGWRWTLHPAGLHPDVYAAAAARDSAEDVRTDKERK